MAAVEVPQTLEYRGGQLNVAPVLEVEIFTNWKKRFMCHIIADERKAANLDQRLKSLIMSVLPDDQMNSVINCLTAKSTWDDLIVYHEGPSVVKESKVMGLNFAITPSNSKKSPFQPRLLLSSENKPEIRNTKDFEVKYNKVKAKLALLSSSASAPSSFSSKNKGLIAESYDWDEEEVSSDDEETEVKALMALTDEERISVGKESARNGEWTKITIKKVHTLLEMEDNDDRKSFLDYLCIDLNYVEEQRNNLSSKHRNLVQELNACKEQLLVLKQAKLDLLTMQHVNTEILKENQNLRLELKELTSITETWLNSSNKVNQCINEQIPTQKKKILGIGQLTEDTSSCGSKDLSSEAEDSTLPNHDTDEIPSNKSQRSTIDPLVVVFDSPASDYDLADRSSVCSTPILPLKKLDGVGPGSGPKAIKSILKSKSMFKAETLKGITLNEQSSTPARGNKSSLASKTNSAPAG
ncbi:hypothetical protein Tco_0912105 [Tanacetum coccineum]